MPVSVHPAHIRHEDKDTPVVVLKGLRREIGSFVASHEFSTPLLIIVVPEPAQSPGDNPLPRMAAPAARGSREPKPATAEHLVIDLAPENREAGALLPPTPQQVVEALQQRLIRTNTISLNDVVKDLLPPGFNKRGSPEDRHVYRRLIDRFKAARDIIAKSNGGHWEVSGALRGPRAKWKFTRNG